MKYLIAKAKSLKTFMNFYDILFLITSCVQASLLLIYKIVMFLFFFEQLYLIYLMKLT